MIKNNSCGKTTFIVEHIYWSFIIWLVYKGSLFRCLDSYTFQDSKLILCVIIIVSCIGSILIEFEYSRNVYSVFSNLALGYGIYTVIGYYDINRNLINVVLSVVALLSILYAILVICRRIKNRRRIWNIVKKRMIQVTIVSQRLVGFGLSLIMMILGFNCLFGSTIMKSNNQEVSSYISERLLADNIEDIVLLQNDSWENLTIKERLNVLQAIANVEQRYLGIPNELNVGTANLTEGYLGYYSDKTHEIVVDLNSLSHDSSSILLDTVCHEAFHSYEYSLVKAFNEVDEATRNLRMFGNVVKYNKEFDNYTNSDKDFCHYYEQQCEIDAREYAAEAVNEYYIYIEDYLYY